MNRRVKTSVVLGSLVAVLCLPARAQFLGLPSGALRSSVSGVVIDTDSGRPLKGAVVRLESDDPTGTRVVLSGQDGRFSIDEIPAGRYNIVPSKAGYVRPRWTVGQPPQAVVVTAWQRAAGIEVRLKRGGAVSGVVTDTYGRGLHGMRVVLFRCSGPERCDVGNSRSVQGATTDDRGAYRVFDLSAGLYAVAVTTSGGNTRDIHATSEAEVAWAEQQLAARGASMAPPAERPSSVTFVATYFPRTTNAAEAEFVQVAEGQEREGVDMTMEVGAAAKITGVVVGADDKPALVRALSIFPNQRGLATVPFTGVNVAENGTFETTNLAPGSYRVGARIPPTADRPALWAAEVVTVNGRDITGVTLTLRPGLSVMGRVVVDRKDAAGTVNLTGTRVELRRVDTPVVVSTFDVQWGITNETGAFGIVGLVPGRYAVICTPPQLQGRSWFVKSAVVDGRDVIDSFLDVGPGASGDEITISITSNPARITGEIRYSNGRPAGEYMVAAFPADKALWTAASRRIRTAAVAADGSFVLTGLPAGEYYLGAVGTNDPEELDRGVLDALSQSSHRLALADRGEQHVSLTVVAAR